MQENTVSATTRVRGLDSADNTRDYFLTDIPWDSFDVGRVDLQRGPNSILFGTGSPAGIINVSTNGASFNNSYNLTNRIDEYGSLRNSAMLNQELIPGILAIRLAILDDNEKYEQSDAFNNTRRYYGAFRFDPKLFGKDSHTSIRGNFERGIQTSDNPRDLPPADEITPWFTSSITVGGVTNPGYNKITENQYSIANQSPGGLVPGGSGGPLSAAMFQMNAGGWSRAAFTGRTTELLRGDPGRPEQRRERAAPRRHADPRPGDRGPDGPRQQQQRHRRTPHLPAGRDPAFSIYADYVGHERRARRLHMSPSTPSQAACTTRTRSSRTRRSSTSTRSS